MVDKSNKTRGLGRGLSALMADVAPEQRHAAQSSRRVDQMIAIERIHPNPNQPRRSFDEKLLQDLASSIAEKGIIQPIIVRRDSRREDAYEIVAGERRWRAAQIAQLHEIPALIREFNDTEVLEIAIIENIQRADLNPVDEAAGYRQLMDRFGHTQDQLASALGKSRSHIANLLRLLNLPDDVLRALTDGKLTAGHARALVGHPAASTLANEIISKGLSVRDAERMVKAPSSSRSTVAPRAPTSKDADTIQIEKELTAALRMKVSIDHDSTGEGGKLTLNYQSLDQLDDILRALSGG